ncbi:hypothetical protein EI94DRAFT_1809260 [Lactarius quietus]|nr:hypothetical protein EI94DRAFT_1809260 [Lactarius quietus]
MLRIPALRVHSLAVNQASSEAWNILEDLATSRKTLPEAEEGLEKVYGSTYQDSVWWPALVAITGSETTEDALEELAKFKAAVSDVAEEVDRQTEVVEIVPMDAVAELKACQRIFGPLPSVEDLVNPPGELETGENLEQVKSDAEIVEAVRKGVSKEEEKEEDGIEECPPPQMSRPEMVKISGSLRSVCVGVDVEAGYELSKVLRKFEAQIRALELQKSTQQRLDGWLDTGVVSLPS